MKTGDKVVMLLPDKYTGRIATVKSIGGLDLVEIELDGMNKLIERQAIAPILVVDKQNETKPFVNPFAKG